MICLKMNCYTRRMNSGSAGITELDLSNYRNIGQIPISNYNVDVRRYNQQKAAFDRLWTTAAEKENRRSNTPMIVGAVMGILAFVVYLMNSDSNNLSGAIGFGFGAAIVSSLLATWITESMLKPTVELADHPVNLLKISLVKRRSEYDQIEKTALYNYMRTQKNYWLKLSGWQFEKEVGGIFGKLGYHVVITKGSGDGGVDLVLNKDDIKYLVQCKNHNKPIGPSGVRDLFGAMHHEHAIAGIFISSTGYTRGALEFAAGKNIQMLDVNDVIRMNASVK